MQDARLLSLLEKAFAHHAGGDARIDAKDLQRALGLRSEYLAKRVLLGFDLDGDGVIRKDEFLAGVKVLLSGSDRDKLLFAFRIHDDDGDGFISRLELIRMISISLAESDVLSRPTQPAETLASALLTLADRDRDGRLSFDEFESVLRRRPELLRQMTRTEAMWIAPNEDLLALIEPGGPRRAASAERDFRPAMVLLVWALANLAVFGTGFLGSIGGGAAEDPLMTAGRALGRCLDLNGALVLVPMMRRLLTRVRASWLGRLLPIDESVGFHKVLGHTLFALALLHGAAFAVAYSRGHAASPLIHLFASRRGLTGGTLLAVFAVMWLFSLPFVRRTKRFELFYFTHLLYVVWLALAVLHAPSFAFWVGLPLLAFAAEQATRIRRRGALTPVRAAEALRSGVTRLELERPPGFAARPGDYAFLRVPDVAKHEWHPFTISSSPDRPTLVFHVRSLGNWTGALRRRVSEAGRPPLAAHVDGPYGSPSAGIFRARHVVLIGAGIGVTPFASVLETLVLRESAASDPPFGPRRVHFVWLNRDQYSFEWFSQLLTTLEQMDNRQLLDIQLFMTGARSGVTAIGLEIAREVLHAAGRSDLITGLRTHTHSGAPDWDALLARIAEKHRPERVDVFFCGPPGLATVVRKACARIGLPFHEERF